MKDEIKEIFRRMNDLIKHQFDKEYHTECDLFKDIQQLLDYITNLQEENKLLKANVELLDDNRIYLNDKIDNSIEFIDRYLKLNLKAFNTKSLLMKIKIILKGENNEKTN